MNAKTERKLSHAERNAEGHAETILALYRAHLALEAGADKADVEGDEYTDADAVRERAIESALSVEVRSGWYSPGEEDKPQEYNILLTTGGPALRIFGELTEFGEADADNSAMQVQDWGTPWTDYYSETARQAEDWDKAFAWFLCCFYFGEV